MTLGGDGFTSLCWPATGAAKLVADNNLESSAPRLCGFSFCPARKAFDPFLVIAIERTGILAPQFLEEEGALLRLLRSHMTTIARGRDDPAVAGARTDLVTVDWRRPGEPSAGQTFRHD